MANSFLNISTASENTLIEEYKTLRNELDNLISIRYTLFSISITALGLVSAIGGNDIDELLLVLPIISLIIIPAFGYLLHTLAAQFHRIVIYINVFLEPELKLNREFAWNYYHKEFKPKSLTNPLFTAYAIILLGATTVPFIYFLQKDWQNMAIFLNFMAKLLNYEYDPRGINFSSSVITSITMVLGMFFSTMLWGKWSTFERREDEIKRWKEIKNKINKNNNQKLINEVQK